VRFLNKVYKKSKENLCSACGESALFSPQAFLMVIKTHIMSHIF
jgi:hypothetical protein